MRLLYVDGMVGAQEVTVGELIDHITHSVLEDIRSNSALTQAIASAVVAHLPVSVRPT